MIKAIIFDLWDTIGSKGFAINKLFKEHFKIEDYPEYHKDYEEAVQITKWSSKDEMAKNFLKTFKLPINKENIDFVVNTYKNGAKNAILFEGMDQLLAELKEKFKLGLISNTTIFEIGFIDRFNIRKYFDSVVCSHDIGKIKPDREIFEEVAKQLSVNLNECLFIDDSKKNIAKAKEYGITTIQFKDIIQLKKELASLGIINS